MEFEFIQLRNVGPVGWLEYNRPPVNAFNWEMIREVPAALNALLNDPKVRVIVFASAVESHFSAGADLEVFGELGRPEMEEWLSILLGAVRTMQDSPKPLLGAIGGIAVGGGLELTFHCDVRFAAEDARLGLPEINIGFIPPLVTLQALTRLVGRARAIRFLYEGTLVPAQEARAMGMVDLLCPGAGLKAEVQAYAAALASKPPEVLATIRRTVNEGVSLSFGEALALEWDAVLKLSETGNFHEGVNAFMGKRPPKWRY